MLGGIRGDCHDGMALGLKFISLGYVWATTCIAMGFVCYRRMKGKPELARGRDCTVWNS